MSTAPHRIVFANEKGGTGKSTTAVHVAVALAYRGARVAAIDLDPRQRTLYRYFENRAETERRRDISLPGVNFEVFEGGSVEELEAAIDRLVTGDLPAGHPIKVIEEHPGNRNVLFAGTEFGLFVTYDGGTTWRAVTGGVPRVRVDDIVIHPVRGDLILGTHGRSIIVLDDVTMLAAGAPVTDRAALYPVLAARQRFVTRVQAKGRVSVGISATKENP